MIRPETSADRIATLALAALICAAAAWLMADPLRTFFLIGDDFAYLAESRTAPRLIDHLWTPHNAHVVPLFRLWTFALTAIAGRLDRLPIVLGAASFGVLVLAMLAAGHLVAREARDPGWGLAAMAAVGLTTVVEPATTWYAAGQTLWAALGILATLIALQSWRESGGPWRFGLGLLAALAAAALWAGGFVAGPVGAAYLWADGRPRCRKAAIGPLLASAVAAIVLMGPQLVQGPAAGVAIGWQGLALRPIRGLLHGGQATIEALILGNLGLDAMTTPAQGAVVLLAMLALWCWSWRRSGPPQPLELAGAAMVGLSYLLVYTFRGNLSYDSLRALGWYHAIPQVGAVLFAAGLALRLRAGLGPPALPRRSWTVLGAVAIASVLLVLQIPRAERFFLVRAIGDRAIDGWPGPARAAGRARALAVASRRAEDQRRFLARLEEAERIAAREGIGREAIRATFGRILGPGMPPEAASLDAADLLILPGEEKSADPSRVRALLGDCLAPESKIELP